MVCCAAPNCLENQNKAAKSHSVNVSFHLLPSDPTQKERWIANMRRANLPKRVLVCSKHFTADQYEVRPHVQDTFGVDTLSTAKGARTTSFLKDLEHRNACVGLAGNNLELAGNGKKELQAIAIGSRFCG